MSQRNSLPTTSRQSIKLPALSARDFDEAIMREMYPYAQPSNPLSESQVTNSRFKDQVSSLIGHATKRKLTKEPLLYKQEFTLKPDMDGYDSDGMDALNKLADSVLKKPESPQF
jgi:hypothetical protein